MTYRELLELLETLSEKELDQNAIVSIEGEHDLSILDIEAVGRTSVTGRIIIEVTPEL